MDTKHNPSKKTHSAESDCEDDVKAYTYGLKVVLERWITGRTWLHAGEPRRKQGIAYAYVSRHCCLQESSSAQQCCWTYSWTMRRVQQHCQRKQQQEADWCSHELASYPGPAQLFVACSTEKRGESGNFSQWDDVSWKWRKFGRTNRLRFTYCSTDYMLNTWCSRLPLARYVW